MQLFLNQLRRRRWLLAALLAACVVFALAYSSPAGDEISDPYFTLLVSQALLEHGTLALDAYETRADPPFFSGGGTDLLFKQNGHHYYIFPVGSSIFSLPVVWLANRRERDMSQFADNRAAQNQMSAVLGALIFFLLYQICAFYLAPAPSLLIALICTLGSSLMSTVGAALWNIDWAVLFVCAGLWLVARYDSARAKTLNPFVLSILLFAAYLCRPTTVLWALIVLIYLFVKARPVLLPALLTLIGLLGAFGFWNWLEFGVVLPPYYSLNRFSEYASSLDVALFGELLSPSRGLFVYSPFFVLTVVGALVFARDLVKQPLFGLSAVWFCSIVLVVAEATLWWGGWSFGPRVLTDAVPALVLLSVFDWKQLAHTLHARRAVTITFLGLGVIGIWINSYVGLFNLDAGRWNGSILPNVDKDQSVIFDWRYPQILASAQSLCARNREYMQPVIARKGEGLIPYSDGAPISFQAPDTTAVFVGWSQPERVFRWSECSPARILFRRDANPAFRSNVIEMTAGSLGPQRVVIYLNGVLVGTMELPGTITPPSTRRLPFDARLLKAGAVNELTLETPDAQRVSGARESRRLGLSFVQLGFKLDDARQEDKE